MLDYIRSNAQSWGVKAAFGIIILVFVFWGVGSLRDSNVSGVVATVNGKPILVMEMENTLRQAEDSLRRTNPEITAEQLRQMQLPRQILQQLIIESALLQEAARLNITVSPVDMRRAVEAMPIFHNDKGAFDPEAYKRIMTAQRQSLSAFEEGIRKRLLEEKLRKDITAGASVTLDEAHAFFNYAQEQREVEYVFFPTSAYPPAAPAEDELKAYYESHRQAFAIPIKLDVEYILARPADLGNPDSFSAEAVQAWYDKNTAKFSTPTRAKVRHILLRLAPDASAADTQKAEETMQTIVGQLGKGADFAALAAKHSQDEGSAQNGGSLDWISPGDTVPPFNDTLFAANNGALKTGETSKPVRTDFGLHLIKVDQMQPAATRALKDVEQDVRAALAEQQGTEKIREALDLIIEGNILGKPLAEVGKAHGLTAQSSGLLAEAELEKLLGIDAKAAQTLLATPAGAPVDTALESGDKGFIVARVKEKTPASTRPFEEVKQDIAKVLSAEKSRETALKAAAEARKALADTAALPATLASKAVTTPAVQRGAPLGELNVQPDVLQAVFAAQPLAWLPSVYEGSVKGVSGAVMLRVKKSVLPDNTLWQPLSEILRSSLDENRRQEMFQAFVSVLLQKAKVEIKNPGYLEQRGS